MRVAVTGATGNVGSALLPALGADSAVADVLAIARRRPAGELASGARFAAADVGCDDITPLIDGADAVVHLAWQIQPSHDRERLRRTNVEGTRRVLDAAARAGVRAVVHASSVGTYSAGPKDRRVDETWARAGVPTSSYSVDKAACERLLDAFEAEHPHVRVVRLRPGLIFQRQAGSEIRRLFAGPLLPRAAARPGLLPLVPLPGGLAMQGVHARDVADAFRRAVVDDAARGPYNVAAEPVLDRARLAAVIGGRPVRFPAAVLRTLISGTWRLHLQPTSPGWLDMGMSVPLMSTARIRSELGWSETVAADDALREVLQGIRDGAGAPTPPLSPDAGGPARAGEVLSGIGART